MASASARVALCPGSPISLTIQEANSIGRNMVVNRNSCKKRRYSGSKRTHPAKLAPKLLAFAAVCFPRVQILKFPLWSRYQTISSASCCCLGTANWDRAFWHEVRRLCLLVLIELRCESLPSKFKFLRIFVPIIIFISFRFSDFYIGGYGHLTEIIDFNNSEIVICIQSYDFTFKIMIWC